MILRSPTENENDNPCRCLRFRLLPPRRGKTEMGVLKQNLRSLLPCLPRQGEGINTARRSAFHLSLHQQFSKEARRARSFPSFILPRVAGEERGGGTPT